MPLHLLRLARAMRERGHRPSVVSLAPAGSIMHMFRDDGFDLHCCEARGRWDFRVIGKLAGFIRETRPDIVHALLFHANVAARSAAGRANFSSARVLCEIQTVEVQRRWHLLVDRLTHWGCRFTVGNSPSVIEHLHKRAGIPRQRLRLVRGGIDPTPFLQAKPLDRSLLGCANNIPIILWVGRLDPVKGLDILLTSFRRVLADTDAQLLLVGDGIMRTQLQAQIEGMELSGRARLLGSRQDIPALLKTADVFAFPSRAEGLPNALLEAMAAGCPIVTTDVPGCRDLVQHNQTGLLVPYGDTAALTAAIRRLLSDRGEAARLGDRASAAATHDWHIERTHDAYAEIYEEITR